MFEKHGAIDSMKRSFYLVKGLWWRVFGVYLIMGIIIAIPVVILFFVAFEYLEIFNLFVSPFVLVLTTMVYIHLRKVKEGYTDDQLKEDIRKREIEAGIITNEPPSGPNPFAQ